MSKRMQIAMVPLSALKNHMCAWGTCRATTPIDDNLPRGWRWLALWAGPVGAPPWADGNIQDRDAVLCPLHAGMLHNDLLKDIGQRLDQPARGRA